MAVCLYLSIHISKPSLFLSFQPVYVLDDKVVVDAQKNAFKAIPFLKAPAFLAWKLCGLMCRLASAMRTLGAVFSSKVSLGRVSYRAASGEMAGFTPINRLVLGIVVYYEGLLMHESTLVS